MEILTRESKIEQLKMKHFIPASQLKWAELMETLVLKRTEVRILPEVGCGLDNLDTLKTTKKLNWQWWHVAQDTINPHTKGAFMRNDTFAFITEPLHVKKPLDSDHKFYTMFFLSPNQRIRISCTVGKCMASKDYSSRYTRDSNPP